MYNGDKFLDNCITSILRQTYTYYEIVIIDDGSTDNSGKIADGFAERYEFVKVFHQENMGLSVARNIGVIKARTDYITFVDADDIISERMLERLICGMKNADMSIIGMKNVGEDFKEDINENVFKFIILNAEEALEDMCYLNHFGVSACGKLFKKELLLKYPFPEGHMYEDLATIYKIIGDCNHIAVCDWKGYYYVQHIDFGITRGGFSEAKWQNCMVAAQELEQYITTKFPRIISAGRFRLAHSIASVTKTFSGGKDDRKVYKEIQTDLRNVLNEGVMHDHNVKIYYKIKLLIISSGFVPMRLAWRLYDLWMAKRWLIKR